MPIQTLPDAKDLLAAATPRRRGKRLGTACLARATGWLHNDPKALTTSIEGWGAHRRPIRMAATLLLLPDRAAEGRAEFEALRPLANLVIG